MKYKIIILLSLISSQLSFTQNVDFRKINYNGLEFYSSKSEIKQKLGNPIKSFEPKYECGFLSADEQSTEYFSLDYGKVRFTGNEKEKYLIEEINFENDPSIVLNYGEHKLTCETELTELVKIFGQQLNKHFQNNKNNAIIIFQKNTDDGIRIEIKDKRLIRFEYWSPC